LIGALRAVLEDLDRVGKPREVEGVLDRYLIRPCGYLVARYLTPSWVSPNALSFMALAFGWLTAWALFSAARLGNPPFYGGATLVAMGLHSAFDSADGQLARARGVTSEFGRILDGVCDYLTFAAIYLAIGFGLGMRADSGSGLLIAVAVLAGLSHALQCATVEFQRNLFRHYVYGTDLPFDPDDIRGAGDTVSAEPLHALHRVYSRIQSVFGGSSLALWRSIDGRLQRRPEESRRIAGVIVAENRLRLKMWALLAPNAHKVGMVVGAFLPVGARSVFGNLGLLWYLLYVVVVLNLLLGIMIISQTRVDRRVWRKIESGP